MYYTKKQEKQKIFWNSLKNDYNLCLVGFIGKNPIYIFPYEICALGEFKEYDDEGSFFQTSYRLFHLPC